LVALDGVTDLADQLRRATEVTVLVFLENPAEVTVYNSEIRNLRTDIGNFGGTAAEMMLTDADPTINRGTTVADKVVAAENALRAARAAGGDTVAAADLKHAEEILKTARMLSKDRRQSENAEHLAYVAEMTARRAEYVARRNAVAPRLPELRLQRTTLAQRQSDMRAQEEQQRRQAAEQQAMELRRQLEAQSANRQAEQAELERLRQQVAASEAQFRTRLEEDRTARIAAEQTRDELLRRYEAALTQGGATTVELEQLRRQVEDQQRALQVIQERERSSESSMGTQINGLQQDLERERNEGRLAADVIAQREAEIQKQRDELQRLTAEREQSERQRVEAENARTAAIADAERRRGMAEAQSEQLRQQVETERARTTQTEAQLAQAREELERRDAASRDRITAMQTELSKLAQTRTSDRGFIVTLPGLFFDTGKSVLKTGAKNTLGKIAEQLRINEDTKIAVEGHTDSVGSDAMNQTLSEKRAAAVRDYLVARGVPAARITTSGLGESAPIATNDTAAGRQQNRRVELVISQ